MKSRQQQAEPTLAPIVALSLLGLALVALGMASDSISVSIVGLGFFLWATVRHCRRHG